MASSNSLLAPPQMDSRHVAGVRDAFLSHAGDDLPGVRPIIARSWYRSRAAGVDADVDRAVIEEGRIDEHTLRAAESHLRRLDELVADVGGYVSLTAPNGSLVKTPFIRSDEGFPHGYSLLEESVGSNGEGLAIEEGRGVWLSPEEHFRSDMRRNWCFASLIRDPFHGRLRAVIGLTFPADRVREVEPESTLLMLEGVRSQIERDIEHRTSSRQRELLNEYLRVSRRRGSAAVIAMDGKNSMMNAHATDLLSGTDLTVVTGYARDVMSSGRDLACEVTLIGVGRARLEISSIQLGSANFGAMIVLRPRENAEQRNALVGIDRAWSSRETEAHLAQRLDGTSAEFRQMRDLAELALADRRSVAVIGEAGAGKRHLADAIASFRGAAVTFDARSQIDGARLEDVLRRVAADRPGTFVLEHADLLSSADARKLLMYAGYTPDTRLILTMTRPTDATQLIADERELLEIPVAPLRSRREDIPVLAHAITAEIGEYSLSRHLIAALTGADWPQNADQLRAVLVDATQRARGPEVTVDDLPRGFERTQSTNRLSRLEDAEYSELRIALRETQGNRRMAADMLGIGRSTLYRRMDYFRAKGLDL
jgi:transcriptional regulator of acetoin/glycerol metabolism